jgi:Ca2+-binding RTX toxin-like protein
VRGTDGAQRFKMAEAINSSDLYLELTGDSAADVKIIGDPSSVVMSLGPGPDTFNAQDTKSLTFLGAPLTLRAVVSEPLTIYGGAGADTLEGGNGNDILDGGDDNDVFQSDATGSDGADTFQGGNGTDVADYTSRTVGVTADIDPGHGRAFVDGAPLYGKTLSAGTALSLSVGGGGTITYISAGVSGSAAILGELNAAAGFAGVASASVDDRGRLVIEADASGQPITILSDNQLLIGGGSPWTGTETDLAVDLVDNDDGATGADERDDVKSDIEHLKGGSGDDILTGSNRSNFIDGGAGNDDLAGGPGGTCPSDIDTLTGGAGDDVFQMGAASNCADAIDGAAGRDTASYELRTSAVTVALDSAANDGESEADNVKSTLEIVLGGDGGDVITGGNASDELHGGPGNDFIKGGAGNDTLVGGTGIDNLLGELGDDLFDEASASDDAYDKPFTAFGGQDLIHGGAGLNTCDYRRGTSTGATFTLCFSAVAANCPPAQNDGPDSDDLTNCTRLILDDGPDNVTGSESNDAIEGGDGADTIDGGAGSDHIYGEAGDDRLTGGAGGDAIDGGPDQSVISDGGAGDDVCVSVAVGSLSCEI